MDGHRGKQQRFAVEYAKDMDARAAALRAGYSQGYAESAGTLLLGNPSINKLVARELRYVANIAGLTPARMISHLLDVVKADPSRISWVETRPCLNCYDDEQRLAFANVPPESGMSLDKPNVDCKLCRGQGIQQTRLADTKTLTRGERELLLGYKTDKDGNISVKIKDKSKELAHLLDIMKLTGNLNLSIAGVGGASDVDTEKLMQKNPKDMTALELELACRIEASRLEAKTIDGR